MEGKKRTLLKHGASTSYLELHYQCVKIMLIYILFNLIVSSLKTNLIISLMTNSLANNILPGFLIHLEEMVIDIRNLQQMKTMLQHYFSKEMTIG
ncbi:hypothetical protein ACFQ9Y_16350 [Peribacillus simplex]|uniref:hypothetical protein n=1 Tax=Peribacillus simplex TaxID=1478 RepID=UPI00367321C0